MPGGSHSPYHGLATLKSLTEKYHFAFLPHVSVCLSYLWVWGRSCQITQNLLPILEPFYTLPSWQPNPVRQL